MPLATSRSPLLQQSNVRVGSFVGETQDHFGASLLTSNDQTFGEGTSEFPWINGKMKWKNLPCYTVLGLYRNVFCRQEPYISVPARFSGNAGNVKPPRAAQEIFSIWVGGACPSLFCPNWLCWTSGAVGCQIGTRRVVSYEFSFLQCSVLFRSLGRCYCSVLLMPRERSADKTEAKLSEFWEQFVECYSTCQMTYYRDRVAGIEGVVEMIRTVLSDGKCHFGIWVDSMPISLLWTRGISHRPLPAIAPTWSWLSTDGDSVNILYHHLDDFYEAADFLHFDYDAICPASSAVILKGRLCRGNMKQTIDESCQEKDNRASYELHFEGGGISRDTSVWLDDPSSAPSSQAGTHTILSFVIGGMNTAINGLLLELHGHATWSISAYRLL